MKNLIFLVLVIGLSQTARTFCQSDISDPVEIVFDNIAFDDNDLLKITDAEGNIIAYYNRYENSGSRVRRAQLFNRDTVPLCKFVPTRSDAGYEVYLQKSNGKKGRITISPDFIQLRYELVPDIDYFGLPYRYEVDNKFNLKDMVVKKSLFYEDTLVLFSEATTSLTGVREAKITLSRKYLNDNPVDAACWLLGQFLIEEVITEYSLINYRSDNPYYHDQDDYYHHHR